MNVYLTNMYPYHNNLGWSNYKLRILNNANVVCNSLSKILGQWMNNHSVPDISLEYGTDFGALEMAEAPNATLLLHLCA